LLKNSPIWMRIRFAFDSFWFYSQPSGSFHGTGSQGRLDLQSDVNFNAYNTGFGRLEWKFTRKNHLYLGFLPVNQSKEVALSRTVLFQGQTYDVGLVVAGRLQTYVFTPGYQYDIIRRRRGHLGIAAQLDVFYIKGQPEGLRTDGKRSAARCSSILLNPPRTVAGRWS
jgi:hypothetical protein